jgi:putative intracellular protease/amidase
MLSMIYYDNILSNMEDLMLDFMGTVHLFLPEGVADWEAAYAVAHLNTPIYPCRRRYRVVTVGRSRAPVTSLGGLSIQPHTTLAELRPELSSLLLLPGGASWDQGENGDAVELARRFLDADVPVAAICGATLGLARGGLLDDRQHTSGAPEYLAASGYKGGAQYRTERAVTDGNLITAGPTGALEFARHIFEKLDYFAPEVAEHWYELFRTGDAKHFFALAGHSK